MVLKVTWCLFLVIIYIQKSLQIEIFLITLFHVALNAEYP